MRCLGGQPGGAAPPRDFPLCGRHPQALLPAQAPHLALAHVPAFLLEQGGDPAVPVARILIRQGMDALHQLLLPA